MNDWIEWSGGECPLPSGISVEVRFRNGSMGLGVATFFDWESRSFGDGIEAYRPIESIEGLEPTPTSIDLLERAKTVQAERAKEYEQAGGERSTAKVVAAFNAITGRDLRESEGWLVLQLLKVVRSEAGGIHADSILDNVSYASLYGEARAAGR